MNPHEYRLRKLKEKQDRKKPAHERRGQTSIGQAATIALDQRIRSGRFGLLAPRSTDEESAEEAPVPIDEIPHRQVSFVSLKRCACGAVNKFISTSCRKCGGHFCYDKTPS